MGSRQILGLDLLRFAAAFLVMTFHLGAVSGFDIAPFGAIGIQIFFLLSGFVIAYTAQGATAKDFAIRRIVRLMPGVWICASLCVVIALLSGAEPGQTLFRYVRTVVLWPHNPWIDGVYHTLITEVAFYLVVAAVLLFGGRRAAPAAILIVGGASAAFWGARVILSMLRPDLNVAPYIGSLTLLIYGGFFGVGGMLWACLLDRLTPARVVALGVFFMAALAQLVQVSGRRGAILYAAIILASMAFIVLSVRLNGGARYARLFRIIGLTTYPLYLLHNHVGKAVLGALPGGVPAPAAFLLAAVVSIAVSAVIATTAEPALQRALNSLLRPKAAPSGHA